MIYVVENEMLSKNLCRPGDFKTSRLQNLSGRLECPGPTSISVLKVRALHVLLNKLRTIDKSFIQRSNISHLFEQILTYG